MIILPGSKSFLDNCVRDFDLFELGRIFASGVIKGNLSANLTYISFEVSDSALGGVLHDDFLELRLFELDDLGLQSILVDLFGHQVLFRYLQLLLEGVS